jgi:hypothetical protein
MKRLLVGIVLLAGTACSGSGTPPAPPAGLTYSQNPAVYTLGSPITPNTPTSTGGAVASYTVAPALPPGMSLNSVTGVIGGTPTAIAALANYTITASNSVGSTTAIVAITVTNLTAPSALVYSTNPAVYPAGIAMTPNTPTSSGGAVTSYAVSPALPTGLSMNPATGVISGTPSAVTPTANYTVTATNAMGSTTASLSITVNRPPPPTIVTQPSDQVVSLSESATFTVTASGAGPLAYQWLRGKSTIGGATAATYSTPGVVRGDAGATFSVVVNDSFGGSVSSPSALLSIQGFVMTGSMVTARSQALIALLSNGKVLVAGGGSTTCLSSAELYDPSTGRFQATGAMAVARIGGTLTTLRNGGALAAGGWDCGQVVANAQVYSPAGGAFIATGNMTTPRFSHMATALADGKVLIAGGLNVANGTQLALGSAEVYDPATGVFTVTGSMNSPRTFAASVLLANGNVLVLGGQDRQNAAVTYSSAELYDPATGVFTATGSMLRRRFSPQAALLQDGRVLVIGGASGSFADWTSAEIYDPSTGSFKVTNSMLEQGGIPTLLLDGKVLVAPQGTISGGSGGMRAELYDPALGAFTTTGSLLSIQSGVAVAILQNGLVLFAGGADPNAAITTAELFDPTKNP